MLRAGAVTLEQLQSVVPSIQLAGEGSGELRKSPGTRHRHYSPLARVRLIEHPNEVGVERAEGAYIGLEDSTKRRV
ncbi:MAG: Sua5 family C-terminal domain-containing protein [Pyrinomonadaceae bacterium]